MDAERLLRLTNRNMIAFDLALGTGALLAPAATLRVLGHADPMPDAEQLFRRCGPDLAHLRRGARGRGGARRAA